MENSPVIWSILPDSVVYLVGPTASGKTEFALKLCSNASSMLSSSPNRKTPSGSVNYWYNIHSSAVLKMESIFPNVKLHQGLPSSILSDPSKYFSPRSSKSIDDASPVGLHNLVVVDDLALECAESANFTRFLTQCVHHLDISVIILVHSLFFEGKYRKLQMAQASYFILFRAPRSMGSLASLAGQMSLTSPNLLKYAFADICTKEYIPLVIDVHKNTDPELTLLSHIFPNQYPICVYQER